MSSNFVDMITTPNEDTTPSGASRRDDLLSLILENPFLLISRVYQSYIGKFLQMSSNLVEYPICICHLIQLSLVSSGVNLLAQICIKHLLPFFQNHCFDPFHYSPLPQILTTSKPNHLLPLVTHPGLSSIIGGG